MYSTVTMEYPMLALRLPVKLEKRLEKLARATGRTKAYYAREAIVEHLDDIEDYYLGMRRLEQKSRGIPLAEIEKRLGLED